MIRFCQRLHDLPRILNALFLEGKLRLRVNQTKSAVAPVGERQFLGHRLLKGGRLGIGPKSLKRAKDRLRDITHRGRGDQSLAHRIAEVNRFTTGWVIYYRDVSCRTVLRDIDQWLRRKLRCVRLKHCKNLATVAAFLRKNGVKEKPAQQLASSGKGWWRLSSSQQAKWAMPNAWFEDLGLLGTRRPPRCAEPCRKPPWYGVRMPGGVRRGRREASPYSIMVDVVAAREIRDPATGQHQGPPGLPRCAAYDIARWAYSDDA
jgi:hypothetical protein